MGFSIEQFKGYFKSDFAKSALFEVFFASFPNLRFQASSAVLPGSSIGSDIFSNGPYRPIQRPVTRTYGTAPINFMLDNEGRCLSALNSMIDSIVTPEGFVSYPDDYESSCTITHYNQSGGTISKYVLEDCYVSNISDVALDWSGGDAIATVACTVNFRSYSMTAGGGGGSAPFATYGESEYIKKIPNPDAGPKIKETSKLFSNKQNIESGSESDLRN